ncbi:MAG: hypothetical protein JEY99_18020 [Spirochaetales bacterium]|nr:hypothetical protein [Spirochaetales bacterium]
MKARLLPIYFKEEKTDKFENQLKHLKGLLGDEAEFASPVGLGDPLTECDAVVFPEILGEAYRNGPAFQAIDKPILLLTSEFATVSMWDWEISNFLEGKGVSTISPYNLEQATLVCRMLATKRKMAESKFLIFQDNPGEGFQPDIFKSFYWWEDQCTEGIHDKFGVTIERRSLKALGEKAGKISDGDAKAAFSKWDYPEASGFKKIMGLNAAKLYLALDREIDSEKIIGMGTNCLNESHSCLSTPCLAWDRLLEERGMIWACEGDTVTLATKVMLHGSFRKPLMMTNIYPFLMGQAALKHEKIPNFPELMKNPDDHVLLAHCGYFGLVPRSFSSCWSLNPPVLEIVNENAHMFDARMKEGPVTVSKLDASMERLMSVKADLKGYIQYDESSDCRNGGIIEVTDGKRFMDKVYSHHIILMEGDASNELRLLGKIMDLKVEEF